MSHGKSVHQRFGQSFEAPMPEFDKSGSGHVAIDGGKYEGTGNPSLGTPVDGGHPEQINPGSNQFPHDHGHDSYEGIPGDGKVPG